MSLSQKLFLPRTLFTALRARPTGVIWSHPFVYSQRTALYSSKTDSAFTPLPLGQNQKQIEPQLQITFTCTAPITKEDEKTKRCDHRSTHRFSRRSYESGIVIVECPGCKNKHLIADHLGWFASTPSHSKPEGYPVSTPAPETRRTIEDLLREKGEEVVWQKSEEEGSTWEVAGEGGAISGH